MLGGTQVLDTYTTVDTIPRNTGNLTGTLTSVGTYVTGAGTLFLSEIKFNDFLFDATQKEIRRIIDVIDNTTLYIETGFTVALAGATIKRTPRPTYHSWTYLSLGAGAMVQGVTLPVNEFGGFSEFDRPKALNPAVIDGSTGNVRVTITY